MALNPCCGCSSLQNGTRLVGIIQMISAISAIAVDVLEMIHKMKSTADNFPPIQIAIFTLALLFAVIGLIFGIFLIIAAQKRNEKYCDVWYYVCMGRTIVYTVITIISAIGGTFAYISIGLIFINIYSMWVVYAFIEEIHYRRLDEESSSANTTVSS